MKLCREAAPERLLNVLDRLMRDSALQNFRLVGGTALALQLGHRVSVDIDLFTPEAFDAVGMGERLGFDYEARQIETAKNTVRARIKDVKIDILAHRYPMLEKPLVVEGVRMAGLKDIAAMKLNAIANRGSKKDFWDLNALFDHFTLGEMLEFFAMKYTEENVWYVEKSLSYFEDADLEPSPRDLRGEDWSGIKANVLRANKL